MSQFPPAYKHDKIEEVFANVFRVRVQNIEKLFGINLSFNRNMIIVREGQDLTLINSARLSEQGLAELEQLGTVKNLVSMGCAHGKDDRFYIDRYTPKTFFLKGLRHIKGIKECDVVLSNDSEKPFQNCEVTILELGKRIEGAITIQRDGGILLLCDTISTPAQEAKYFNVASKILFTLFGVHKTISQGKTIVPKTLIFNCKIKKRDLEPLRNLSFNHLLSAHGDPIHDNAHEMVVAAIDDAF